MLFRCTVMFVTPSLPPLRHLFSFHIFGVVSDFMASNLKYLYFFVTQCQKYVPAGWREGMLRATSAPSIALSPREWFSLSSRLYWTRICILARIWYIKKNMLPVWWEISLALTWVYRTPGDIEHNLFPSFLAARVSYASIMSIAIHKFPFFVARLA